MNTTRKPVEILAGIAGWESAVASRLGGGFNNATFKVDKSDASAVLKVDLEERRPPFNTRLQEALIQQRAHEAGFAAKVLHADGESYLTSYVQGTVWTAESFSSRGNLHAIADTLQRLHELPLSGRVYDAAGAAAIYCERICAKLHDTFADAIQSCRSQIKNVGAPKQLRCCHNDLVAANIISTPELLLLDWEYACDNDPLFDLATLIEHHELSESQVRELLQAYAGERASSCQVALDEQRILYLALLCLWMLSRDDCNPAHAAKVVARLATRCS